MPVTQEPLNTSSYLVAIFNDILRDETQTMNLYIGKEIDIFEQLNSMERICRETGI